MFCLPLSIKVTIPSSRVEIQIEVLTYGVAVATLLKGQILYIFEKIMRRLLSRQNAYILMELSRLHVFAVPATPVLNLPGAPWGTFSEGFLS